jgi:hypothetical protein
MAEELWGASQLDGLLKEGFICERPYSQAFCLIMGGPDWRGEKEAGVAPYYLPLQRFEESLRKEGLVPPTPPMFTDGKFFRAELNQKITG